MKTKEQLESLFEDCLIRLIETRNSMKEISSKRKSKPFKKSWYATSYVGMEDFYALHKQWHCDITRLNHLRQALWNHGIYKQLITWDH